MNTASILLGGEGGGGEGGGEGGGGEGGGEGGGGGRRRLCLRRRAGTFKFHNAHE